MGAGETVPQDIHGIGKLSSSSLVQLVPVPRTYGRRLLSDSAVMGWSKSLSRQGLSFIVGSFVVSIYRCACFWRNAALAVRVEMRKDTEMYPGGGITVATLGFAPKRVRVAEKA